MVTIPWESSNVHENIFQDPIDGSMSQLGASTSTSNFLLPLASASPSMYQLEAPSPTPQFQISPAYTPMQVPHFLIDIFWLKICFLQASDYS